jgi:hypothetical protein
MFEKDYIIRAIEELFHALARIRRARREERHGEARADIEATCRSITGLELEQARSMGHDALRAVLPEPERRAIVARLLSEYGETLAATGGDGGADAGAYLRAAFVLYDELDQRDELPSEGGHREALAALVERL